VTLHALRGGEKREFKMSVSTFPADFGKQMLALAEKGDAAAQIADGRVLLQG